MISVYSGPQAILRRSVESESLILIRLFEDGDVHDERIHSHENGTSPSLPIWSPCGTSALQTTGTAGGYDYISAGPSGIPA
jgi:hypothetical protein